MKKKITLFIFMVAMVIANCQTTIPEGKVSGTWTQSGSPYLIRGDIEIAPDSTLNIQPGVTVEFQDYYRFRVLGRLLAMGTIADSIIFTAADTTTRWRGLYFEKNPSTKDSSNLKYCVFKYGRSPAVVDDHYEGVLVVANFRSIIISHCLLADNFSEYSIVHFYESNPIFTHNAIVNNLGTCIQTTNSNCIISYCLIANNFPVMLNPVVYLNGGMPTFFYNAILNNTSGSGIVTHGDARISYNIVSGNGGGGILSSVDPIISYNIISNNGGVGIRGTFSNISISNNLIYGNTFGGLEFYSSNGSVVDNIIYGNGDGYEYGGGISIISSYRNFVISGNTISNNYAHTGGGIFCREGNNILIDNNIIINNTALKGASSLLNSGSGGGIYLESYNGAMILNNTISHNSASDGGGGVAFYRTPAEVHNSILYGDSSTRGAEVFVMDFNDPSFYHCNIKGGIDAFDQNGNNYQGVYKNNINSDPRFIAPSAATGKSSSGIIANWCLQASSPCINAGNPVGNYPAKDKAGKRRVVGGSIDIGAFEFQGSVDIKNYNQVNSLTIYPRPLKTMATIQLPGRVSHGLLAIYNLYGQLVRTMNISGDNLRIDRAALPAGLYLITVTENSEIIATDKLLITD